MARLFAGLFFSPAAFSYTKIFSILTKNGKSTADKKVVRGSNVLVLASHAGLNSRSKSGYEHEVRVIKDVKMRNIIQPDFRHIESVKKIQKQERKMEVNNMDVRTEERYEDDFNQGNLFIMKRSGERVPFDASKIVKAIEKANAEVTVPIEKMEKSKIEQIAEQIKRDAENAGRDLSVEEIQDKVENAIMIS